MPSSKKYKRNYQQERLSESKERVKKRALRNSARRQLMKEGKVRKGDKKHVDHKRPLSKGGSNRRSNLRVRGGKSNSSYKRTSSGAMKYRSQR